MSEENIPLQIPKFKSEFKVLSLDLIDDPMRPIRSDLSPESVADLVISIRQVGIIEPLVVKPVNGRYEVIAGHRRLVAATICEVGQVPCYVVEADPQVSEMLKVHENLFRQEISPADEAKFYDWLIQHYKLTPAKIGGMITRSHSYVMDRLEILEYPQELRDALTQKKIKFSVAREFFKIKDIITMRKFLYYAIRSGITPALAVQWVNDWKRTQTVAQPQTQNQTVGDTEGEEYITYVNCIYCKEELRLFDALPVHIHKTCYNEVSSK